MNLDDLYREGWHEIPRPTPEQIGTMRITENVPGVRVFYDGGMTEVKHDVHLDKWYVKDKDEAGS